MITEHQLLAAFLKELESRGHTIRYLGYEDEDRVPLPTSTEVLELATEVEIFALCIQLSGTMTSAWITLIWQYGMRTPVPFEQAEELFSDWALSLDPVVSSIIDTLKKSHVSQN